MFPEEEVPPVRDAPVYIQEIGAVEHIAFIEHLFVELLPHPVTYFGVYVAEYVQIKIIPCELAFIAFVTGLLMERSPHVHEKIVYLLLPAEGHRRQEHEYCSDSSLHIIVIC